MSRPNYLTKVLEQGSAVWGALRLVRSDNWQNVLTGLGTSRDKTVFGRFVALQPINEVELTSLYHENDTAKRVVALKPQEMMRKGFEVNIEDDTEASSAVGQKLRDLRAGQRLRDGMIWGRLYGGAAMIVGADDGGASEEPLDETRIKSVEFLHVVDKRYLVPESYFEDPLSKDFGEPQAYRVITRRGTTNVVIHRSRLLFFGGAHTSDEERDRLGGWDHSVLRHVYDPLRQFDSVWKAAEHLVSDASQAVFKIQGLLDMIAGGQKDVLATRMTLVDMSRSVARAILLDADGGEEFSREATSFTDAATMVDKFMLRLASAAETPVTILMGQSPAGMNATGESDFRWFYDTIATAQKNDLQPEVERLVRILMLAKDGPTKGAEPDVWSIKWAPLWQPTPSEQAELEKEAAEKDKIYIDSQVLLPEEVALSRFRPEGWSPETQINREVREALLKSETAAPTERELDETTEPDEAESGKLTLAPTDLAIITRVNEGRASENLPPLSDEDGGSLFIAQFKAQQEAEGAKVGAAEGDVAADEIDPSPDLPPAMQAQQVAPFGAPAVTGPEGDEKEPDDEDE